MFNVLSDFTFYILVCRSLCCLHWIRWLGSQRKFLTFVAFIPPPTTAFASHPPTWARAENLVKLQQIACRQVAEIGFEPSRSKKDWGEVRSSDCRKLKRPLCAAEHDDGLLDARCPDPQTLCKFLNYFHFHLETESESTPQTEGHSVYKILKLFSLSLKNEISIIFSAEVWGPSLKSQRIVPAFSAIQHVENIFSSACWEYFWSQKAKVLIVITILKFGNFELGQCVCNQKPLSVSCVRKKPALFIGTEKKTWVNISVKKRLFLLIYPKFQMVANVLSTLFSLLENEISQFNLLKCAVSFWFVKVCQLFWLVKVCHLFLIC